MTASVRNRAPWRVVLPVLVGGLAAITSIAWATLNPSDAAADILGGSARVKATDNGQPARIDIKDLQEFSALPAGRRKLVETAIAVSNNSPWLPYRYGGADPASGGFDCSGAMYYVMTSVGLTPPRTAMGQYVWLRDHQQLRSVPHDATTDHSSLARLRPGDLLFWATDPPADHAKITTITHVAMYLGREKKDGLQIMANATDGRSYRGTKANGYGVYDFRLSSEASQSTFVGYGPPPGMTEIEQPSAPAPDDAFAKPAQAR
jgi:cell wall-associated NlpC family hydrolase